MATSTSRSPARKAAAAKPSARKTAVRKRAAGGSDALDEMVEAPLAKVQVNSKIDRALAREVDLLIRDSDESLSQFVAAAIENEWRRRTGIRAKKELTLKDISTQIEDLKRSLAVLGEYNLAEARQANAVTRRIAQAVGVELESGTKTGSK